ncbi:MAG: integrase [Rhodospirillaceae bacterium]|nr:integrase [Rhodospirillaceae bacterium]
MGRTVNEAKITTPNARSKIPLGKTVHWRAIDRGAHIGYRKGKDGGSWIARFRHPDRTYVTKALGKADDELEADGEHVLTYSQAQKAAQRWCEEMARPPEKEREALPPYTVGDALDDYLKWFGENRKSVNSTRTAINSMIRPALGDIAVTDLTPAKLREWHQDVASQPPRMRTRRGKEQQYRAFSETDPEAKRRRRATANRLRTIVRAALNHAWHEGKINSDDAWRRTKPFRDVEAARVRYLSAEECRRLANACQGNFRHLVQGALHTGARYGELIHLQTRDFDADAGTLFVAMSKSGKSRHVVLTSEARAFFERVTAGQPSEALIFRRDDGEAWSTAHQVRPIREACKAAKINPPAGFHILRHTHASVLAMKGTPMAVIAAQLGHSDSRMAERHYAHLSPSYVADTIRANLPAFGFDGSDENIVALKEHAR